MKKQIQFRIAVWLLLVVDQVVWVVCNRPINLVPTFSVAFWWGVIGLGLLLIWGIFQVTTDTLERDWEAVFPRNAWQKAHALGRRIEWLEGELADAREELAAELVAAQTELDQLGQLAAAGSSAASSTPSA